VIKTENPLLCIGNRLACTAALQRRQSNIRSGSEARMKLPRIATLSNVARDINGNNTSQAIGRQKYQETSRLSPVSSLVSRENLLLLSAGLTLDGWLRAGDESHEKICGVLRNVSSVFFILTADRVRSCAGSAERELAAYSEAARDWPVLLDKRRETDSP
jgi:hypothetical protein